MVTVEYNYSWAFALLCLTWFGKDLIIVDQDFFTLLAEN